MTRRGRLRDELRRLGNSPVPMLDPTRAQRLERRVLSAARPHDLELVDAESVDPPRAISRRVAVVALAAACLLGVIVIASLDRAGSSDRIVSMSGDVDVVLPDGTVVEGTAGMTIPDGAILRLGSDGEAEFDGMTISGAGDYLVTPDGLTLLSTSSPPPNAPRGNGADEQATDAAEEPVVASRPGSTEPDTPTTVPRPTTTERESAATTPVRPTTTGRDTVTTSVQPTTSQRVAAPPPLGSLEPRPTASPTPTTSSAPAPVPPPSRSEAPNTGPAPLDVSVRSDGRRVVFAWRAIAGAAGYTVAALPAVGDGESPWPPAPGVELTDLPAGTLQHSVTRPSDGSWSYRIAAVAPDGGTLALSRVFTIAS